ncbi:MAG: hypothetical protein P8074_05325 [Anaerolineales bacterium]
MKKSTPSLFILIVLIVVISSNGCVKTPPPNPTNTPSQTLELTYTPVSRHTPTGIASSRTPSPIPITTSLTENSTDNFKSMERYRTTPVPTGVFTLMYYQPLIMEYDSSEWRDDSQYTNSDTIVNYLQSRKLETCTIGTMGPSGFFPLPDEIVQLGDVEYQVKTNKDIPKDSVFVYYFENNSLAGYNYDNGIAVLVVQASLGEWNNCISNAEKILATLHTP